MSDHLYIHIPFCLKKCGYCDFYSLDCLDRLPGFLAALSRELRLRAPSGPFLASSVETIYFGGGTPSLVPVGDLAAIFDIIHDKFNVAEDAEITLEANPGTVNAGYFDDLRSLGVNRLSLGIQSFNRDKLKLLGRIHDDAQGRAVIDQARRAGFDNIGLDLIYGLPEESARDWEQEMRAALTYEPEHLSCYMLTLEPGTPLHQRCEAGKFQPMEPAAQTDLFSLTSDKLGAAGYDHYEISNFAVGERRRSRHNSAYWCMKPYMGFGPSAHSLAFENGEENTRKPVRSWNLADLALYIEMLDKGGRPVEDEERLTPAQQMAELVMVGLRTREGMDLRQFDALSDSPFVRRFSGLVAALGEEGLGAVVNQGGRFALTRKGWARLDSIVAAFAGEIL